jgi:hypothetical protein
MYRSKNGEKWICAKCGGEIKELPFEPFRDEEGNLKSLYITKSAFLKNKNYLR